MWPFSLTLLLGILLVHNVHAEPWKCNDLLKRCTGGNRALLNIKMINSNNINYFCENYTQSVIPCLANQIKWKAGITHRERYLVLRKCIENDRSKKTNSGSMLNTIKILRLYLYSCIYNSMADMSQSSCYNKLVQNCVEKNPTTRNCYYWPCKSNKFLTLKRSNVRLEKGDEENEDEEHLDLANKRPETVHKLNIGNVENEEVAGVTSNLIVQESNFQEVKHKFTVHLVVYLYFYSLLTNLFGI